MDMNVPSRDSHVNKAPSSSTTSSTLHPSQIITDITSASQFQHAIAQDKVTVVKFHSTRCKTCQKFGALYKNTCRKYTPLQWLSVEQISNAQLCRDLNIVQLPTVQFYFGGQLLTEFPCPPAQQPKFQATLEQYSKMTPEELCMEAELRAGRDLLAQANLYEDEFATEFDFHEMEM
jgi:thioredoxin 1